VNPSEHDKGQGTLHKRVIKGRPFGVGFDRSPFPVGQRFEYWKIRRREQLRSAPPDDGDAEADDRDSKPPISADAFAQEGSCSKRSRGVAQGAYRHHETDFLK
jgi:hypothetical protein